MISGIESVTCGVCNRALYQPCYTAARGRSNFLYTLGYCDVPSVWFSNPRRSYHNVVVRLCFVNNKSRFNLGSIGTLVGLASIQRPAIFLCFRVEQIPLYRWIKKWRKSFQCKQVRFFFTRCWLSHGRLSRPRSLSSANILCFHVNNKSHPTHEPKMKKIVLMQVS